VLRLIEFGTDAVVSIMSLCANLTRHLTQVDPAQMRLSFS
jgi:hypothetical protein